MVGQSETVSEVMRQSETGEMGETVSEVVGQSETTSTLVGQQSEMAHQSTSEKRGFESDDPTKDPKKRHVEALAPPSLPTMPTARASSSKNVAVEEKSKPGGVTLKTVKLKNVSGLLKGKAKKASRWVELFVFGTGSY